MRIAMIGTGYVGLVSGACFADFGHQVTCVDKDGDKIAALLRGEIPIFEPGLDALVASNVKAGRLNFTTDLKAPVAEADAVFIAVGTPSRRGDGHADLSYVHAAAREIAAALSGFTVVVTKSTVPVGTGDEVERLIRETNPSADFVGRLQSGISARGRGDPRFQVPRPHRGRHLGRARAKGAQRYLPAAVAEPGAADVHGAAHRGADQIRGECVPRHQDHLHQRDRGPRRKGRRRRAGSRARHRARQPHRRESFCMPVPASAARAFRRTPARWSRSRRITTCSCASSRPCSASTTTASARWRARCPTRPAAACAARRSPCSASPSSPTPTTCARRRRSRW